MEYTLGIDIGGTFTDVILLGSDGSIQTSKVLNTPDDLVESCITGLAAAQGKVQGDSDIASDIVRVTHGTTQATNALIERKEPPVALLVTAGFRDLFAVAGGRRSSGSFDLLWDRWEPPISRVLTFDVPERMAANGEEVTPLDRDAVRAIGAKLAAEPSRGIAVSLFHAHTYPGHEQAVREILGESLPDSSVIALSSDVWPESGELPRTFATIFSAYIGPIMRGYLERLEAALQHRKVSGKLQVMQSNGGVVSVERTVLRPLLSIESGPAAGALAAGDVGMSSGYSKVISLDMGGTTAKAALVENGKPLVRSEFQLGGSMASGREGGGGGVLLDIPVLDLAEVGAGGGSVAWVDRGKLLHVGPRSSGAQPGPACYGRGGSEATVTDANLVLGYLSPSYFLGGEMQLSVEPAEKAIAQIGEALGLSVTAAASAIYDVANLNMEDAIRTVSVGRGIDPRDYVMMGFGGAGPTHVARLAEAFDIETVIVPRFPGLFSVVGLLSSDSVYEEMRMLWWGGDEGTTERLNQVFEEIEAEPRRQLAASGYQPDEILSERLVDVRFKGQGHDLHIAPEEGPNGEPLFESIHQRFLDEYERTYGFRRDGVPFIVRACRVRVRGHKESASPEIDLPKSGSPEGALKGRRPVFFRGLRDFADTPVYERRLLPIGAHISGPAIIEEVESTTVVPPQWRATIDEFGNVLMTTE